jgi:RHS repeat-associated protein
MAYDGLNRRVRIEERDGTNSTVTNYLWCGSQICQKLDDGNSIIAEYFDQGEEHDDIGAILLYQKDQLGSIRGTVAPNSTQQGSATYTAYGQTDRSSGVQADKGYAGMFLHQPSGLYLTWYRAYDPVTGRWLSRDPIKEWGGINLYGYVLGDPVNFVDPEGLQAQVVIPIVIGGAIAAGACAATPSCNKGVQQAIQATVQAGAQAVQAISDAIGAMCSSNSGAGRWSCTASCNVQVINPALDGKVPGRVIGSANGKTQSDACVEAKRVATQSAPTGTYARHCQCSCSKN